MTFRAFRGDPFQMGIIQKWVTYNLTIFKGEIFMTLNMSGMELRGCEMEKEEIIQFFLDTVVEFEPENLEEYIAEIKKNSHPLS